MMKKSGRKGKFNKGALAAVGAAVVGVATGAAAMFLSKKENRDAVKSSVDKTVRSGKSTIAKAKKKIAATKKKVVAAKKKIVKK